MPVTDYNKWSNFEDSDDEEQQPNGRIEGKSQPSFSKEDAGEKQKATVAASFIIRSVARDGKPCYLNVCSSDAVEGGMRAQAARARGLDASLPYIVGDPRTDEDVEGDCHVIECLFHPDTILSATKNKQTAETVITTALAVVSELAIPLDKQSWALFEPEALREVNGTHFFAPGKLKLHLANSDLEGVE